MYKVFFNDSFLLLADTGFHLDNTMHLKLSSFNQVEKWLIEAENAATAHNLVLNCPDPQVVLKKIIENYKFIEAAGGLVKNKNGKYLFIFRRGKWDLPKGKMDDNETYEQAAIREVIEETGLKNIFITDKIIDTYHFYRTKTRMAVKKTYWYAMTNLGSDKLIPQYDEDIEEAKWFKPEQVSKLMENMFGSVKDVVLKHSQLGSKVLENNGN